MKIRSNWWLAFAAVVLLAYVALVERRTGPRVSGAGGASATFSPIASEALTGIEFSISNRVVALQRTAPDAAWRLRLPVEAPADAARVSAFLRALERLQVTSYLGPAEATAAGGARAFGLEEASGTRLTVTQRDGSSVIFQLGLATLGGNRFYLQRSGQPGVFVVERTLLDLVPASADDWRDRRVFAVPREGFDRVELGGAVEFRAERDAAGDWRLKRPLDARADTERISTLTALLAQLRIVRFIADRAVPDLESYGLQTPVVDLTLGRGAQDVLRLRFGAMVADDPGSCYALRNGTNLITVPARILEPLSRPLAEYRDRRLLGNLPPVQALEFVGSGGALGFRVERAEVTATNWWVTAPRRFPADGTVMNYFLRQFAQFEVADFTSDIVTDFARYGLKSPLRAYRLLNGSNVLAEIQLGSPLPGRPTLLHARRTDEPSVYGLPISVLGQLADSAAQLRDFRFAATNVARVVVRKPGGEGVLVRTPGGWTHAGGKLDSIAAGNLDLTLNGLGALQSDRYALTDPRQEAHLRDIYRMAESPLSLTVELLPGAARGFSKWSMELGGEIGAARVAVARFDDDPTPLRLQVPLILFEDLLRDLVW